MSAQKSMNSLRETQEESLNWKWSWHVSKTDKRATECAEGAVEGNRKSCTNILEASSSWSFYEGKYLTNLIKDSLTRCLGFKCLPDLGVFGKRQNKDFFFVKLAAAMKPMAVFTSNQWTWQSRKSYYNMAESCRQRWAPARFSFYVHLLLCLFISFSTFMRIFLVLLLFFKVKLDNLFGLTLSLWCIT